MDIIHRERINSNLPTLVQETNYDPLIDSISKLDKENVVPGTLRTSWKRRRKLGGTRIQLNRKFYQEIQCRGPKAFQLLIRSLQDSGQQSLVELLDPTLRRLEAVEEEYVPPPFYPEDGLHFMYIDKSWDSETCNHDRKAITAFLAMQGYSELETDEDWSKLKENEGSNVGSIIVVNFCSMANEGVVERDDHLRERDWIYERFNHVGLGPKPKILLSFRYLQKESKNAVLEHDSGKILKQLFKNMFQVKIYLDASKKKPEEMSDEMKILLRVLAEEIPLDLSEKLQKLQNELNTYGMLPVQTQDVGFSKRFKLKKY